MTYTVQMTKEVVERCSQVFLRLFALVADPFAMNGEIRLADVGSLEAEFPLDFGWIIPMLTVSTSDVSESSRTIAPVLWNDGTQSSRTS